MTKCIRGGLPVALAVLAVGVPGAAAAPVSVNLRVEGSSRTLFDGPVTTDGHDVTTASSMGPHKCDGTNGVPPANDAPGPSATAALDDGARLGGFDFDGTYNAGFDDFLIDRIGADSGTADKFWGFFVNSVAPDIGGCQKRVAQGDEVLWAYAAFGAPPLKLAGPGSATTGQTVAARVTNAQTGAPEAGAAIGSSLSGADGNAALTFTDAGIYRLKADRADAIRSNTLVLCVDPPGAEPCTSGDTAPPRVAVDLPGRRLASERGRSRTVLVSWQADDAAGAGVARYSLDVSTVAETVHANRAPNTDWRSLVEGTMATGAHFRGRSGAAYRFRITAIDRAANQATVVTDPLILPVDDRDRGLWRLARGWKRVRSRTAWGRTVVRAADAGATGTLRFRGRSVSVIGRRLARGGRLRVTVDGRRKVLRLRGRSAPRSVLWTSAGLGDRSHVLRIRTLGGGPVELDAVAPRP
jgi:hypothetical protein